MSDLPEGWRLGKRNGRDVVIREEIMDYTPPPKKKPKKEPSPVEVLVAFLEPIAKQEQVAAFTKISWGNNTELPIFKISGYICDPVLEDATPKTVGRWIQSHLTPALLKMWLSVRQEVRGTIAHIIFVQFDLDTNYHPWLTVFRNGECFNTRTGEFMRIEEFGAKWGGRYYDKDLGDAMDQYENTPLFDGMLADQNYDLQSILFAGGMIGRQMQFPLDCCVPLCPVFAGPSGTGKSEMMHIVMDLCGGLSKVMVMNSTANQRFQMAACESANSAVVQEMQANTNIGNTFFLQMTNVAEPKVVEYKGRDSYTVVRKMPIMCFGNTWLTKVFDRMGASKRRIVLLPMMELPKEKIADYHKLVLEEEGHLLAIKLPILWHTLVTHHGDKGNWINPDVMGSQLFGFHNLVTSLQEERIPYLFLECCTLRKEQHAMTAGSFGTFFKCDPSWTSVTASDLLEAWHKFCERMAFDKTKMTIDLWVKMMKSYGIKYDMYNSDYHPTFKCMQMRPEEEWYKHPRLPFLR